MAASTHHLTLQPQEARAFPPITTDPQYEKIPSPAKALKAALYLMISSPCAGSLSCSCLSLHSPKQPRTWPLTTRPSRSSEPSPGPDSLSSAASSPSHPGVFFQDSLWDLSLTRRKIHFGLLRRFCDSGCVCVSNRFTTPLLYLPLTPLTCQHPEFLPQPSRNSMACPICLYEIITPPSPRFKDKPAIWGPKKQLDSTENTRFKIFQGEESGTINSLHQVSISSNNQTTVLRY